VDAGSGRNGQKRESLGRIFHLLRILITNECTRQEIYQRLPDYYKGEGEDRASRRADRMFERDIKVLEEQGFVIKRAKTRGHPARYSLVKGSGPAVPSSFNEEEVDILALLHNLFIDPAASSKHPHTGVLLLPAAESSHNPFAAGILGLIKKLATSLPPDQLKHFEERIKRPSIHLNLTTAADYLPYRATLDTVEKAILSRQQIGFNYTSVRSKQESVVHQRIDPYYIIYLDGHFYLIGYSNTHNKFLEFRIDRIQAESLAMLNNTIDTVRQRPAVEFSYWIDGEIAKRGLSQRWLTQTTVREEAFIDGQGQEKRRVLVRAKAHNEWRVIQQLLKYGDQAELVEPAHLREHMRQAVARMTSFYEKKDLP
jgi:predicted DNA-binding transcriptional regulator YafY